MAAAPNRGFEPPRPVPVPLWLVIVGTIGLLGYTVFLRDTVRLIALLASPLLLLIWAVWRPEPAPPPPLDLSDTAPVQATADGRAVCTGCGAAVPFADMALDERGYFCTPCTLARRT